MMSKLIYRICNILSRICRLDSFQEETGFVAIIHPTEFNKIVDLYGRKAGGELLRQMAERMNKHLPGRDELISRFSNSIILGIKSKLNRFTSHDNI